MKTSITQIPKYCQLIMAVTLCLQISINTNLWAQPLKSKSRSSSMDEANSLNTSLFPSDKNVSNLKNFWIKIFSVYSDEQTIVHDKNDPHIFYQVINHPRMEHFTRKRLVKRTELKEKLPKIPTPKPF